LEIVVSRGPASLCAAFLAGSLGAGWQLTELSMLEAARKVAGDYRPDRSATDFCFVGFPDEFEDAVLFELLQGVALALNCDVGWEAIPHLSLLTARDLPSLSRLIGRIVASSLQDSSPRQLQRIAYYEFPGSDPLVRELTREGVNGSGCAQPVNRIIEHQDNVFASYTKPSDVIVVATHGFEACADAGSGVVLCGLHSVMPDFEKHEIGVLACARGYDCPRGPQPMPLRLLQTPVLMLASCNSFRFADSQLKPEFNLGLCFMDGEGRDYVSTPLTISHAQPSSVAFAAAMASGCSVAEATALVNGLLYTTGIDQPAFLGIGTGTYRLGNGADRELNTHTPALPCQIDFADANHTQILVSDPRLLESAKRRTLVLDLGSCESQERVYYFYRLETNGAGQALRLFFFSFPQQLKTIVIKSCEISELREDANAVIEASEFWLDFVRVANLEPQIPNLAPLFGRISRMRANVAVLLANAGFDGSAVYRLRQQLQVLRSLTTMIRDLSLDHLMQKVSGSFLLTNVWSDEYERDGQTPAICPNCSSSAVHKKLRHSLHGSRRVVTNCWRCGYVEDVPATGELARVRLEAPLLAVRGQPLHVRLRITSASRKKLVNVRVWARINAQCVGHLVPENDGTVCELHDGAAEVNFRFDLPAELPPHGYAMRALVAAHGEIAAASRSIFVAEYNEVTAASLDVPSTISA
jgi:hypothetical protein